MNPLEVIDGQDWQQVYSSTVQSHAVKSLEQGKVLFFPQLPFKLLDHELALLAVPYQEHRSKNISFNIKNRQIKGMQSIDPNFNSLQSMMSRFANYAHILVKNLLQPYGVAIQMGRTSFRPIEIAGRIAKSYRKDDTRLHVDAFPTTPMQGRRILRVFANIHPDGQERVWRTGEPFEEVARRFYPTTKQSWLGRSTLLNALKITKSYCTEYDFRMLQIHNNMKADLDYQRKAAQQEVRFPAGTSWIVQTDHVSHAAMSGKHVLEQTLYLPINAMLDVNQSPLRTLEALAGMSLI